MVSLVKGQKVDLTKGNAGLKKILVGLGWDTNKYDGDDFDLDASAFLLDKNGKVTTDKDFVFFNNLVHPSGAVKHMGDNLTGSGDGDDEQIIVDLAKIPENIEKIAFTVTIYEADSRMQNFGHDHIITYFLFTLITAFLTRSIGIIMNASPTVMPHCVAVSAVHPIIAPPN